MRGDHRRWRHCAIILLLPLFAVVIVALTIEAPNLIGRIGYAALFPWYSAQFDIKELGATVSLGYYLISDETQSSGRYITVRTPSASNTWDMCGFDWAHRGRTSIYLAGEKKIGVVGTMNCDYVISTEPLQISSAFKTPSDGWTYLGAFDFEEPYQQRTPPVRKRILRFFPASEQGECIKDEMPRVDWAVRKNARRDSCRR